jgi:hypothetical protein
VSGTPERPQLDRKALSESVIRNGEASFWGSSWTDWESEVLQTVTSWDDPGYRLPDIGIRLVHDNTFTQEK